MDSPLPLILHYAPDNASLVIRLVLEEMGLPYKTTLVDRSIRAQDTPAYRAVNPTGLIPALQTADATIFETGAIVLWLCDTQAKMAPLPAAKDRADFLKWLFFISNTLHADARVLFYPEQYAGSDAAMPAFRRMTEARIQRHLGLLDQMVATDPAFMAAGMALPYYLCCLLRWIQLYPTDRFGWLDLAQRPALHALCQTLETRPAVLAAMQAEGLGPTPFSAPQYGTPPEGSAL